MSRPAMTSILCLPTPDERIFVTGVRDGSSVTVTIGDVLFVLRDSVTADVIRDAFDRAGQLLRDAEALKGMSR